MKAPSKSIAYLAIIFVVLILLANVGQIVRVFEHANSLESYLNSALILIVGAGVPTTFIVMLALKVGKKNKSNT
ncbi:TPA: hypothetical protein ACQVKY_005270 [Serratia marcescens]|uniref:DUF1049 domain-containing protein n=1 Tax=Serratia nevei TaxID=2703794 RepID=A0ABT7G5I6_9GAMM|nr:hypothetical protein [Serratia nevei]HAU4290855.1 hypothetical protein [Serratia marcescens]MDK5169025.1 hypothetical protein [Serratia nevei]MDK5298519.1 hypothetical protein [Serratia nevei]MEC5887229.1 hypothetical protein [Serratia nevei]HAU4297491.1 hypothetical protein [Serratia marcescens]